ncbi:MAG: hypothetical protein PW791_03270 [Neorhizobium sp.]|jgi:hypothetical protein|nr:hypothetical protein [Neorhizobium sp.]
MAISICLYGLSLMGIMAYIWANPPHKTSDRAIQPDTLRVASEAYYTH